MDLDFTEEQKALMASVRGFVGREVPPSSVAQWSRFGTPLDRRAYSSAARVGWIGMMAPVELGGGGAEARDCAVVFEQLGRAPTPGPFFTSGVLAPLLIDRAGNDEQRHRLLPRLCDGTDVYAVALGDGDDGGAADSVDMSARLDGGHMVLRGRKRFVPWAESANRLLCLAQGEDGPVLAVTDLDQAGIEVKRHKGFLGSLCDIELDGIRAPAVDVLDNVTEATMDRAIQPAMGVLAAFMVGACDRIFDMVIDYANERVVFGQPIGRFQRVQDHCVDLVNHLDRARWVTYETLWRVDSGMPYSAEVHEAKAVTSASYYEACNCAHMVLAGPGTALDHQLVAHTLMSRMLYQYLGSPRRHKEQMMRELLDRR